MGAETFTIGDRRCNTCGHVGPLKDFRRDGRSRFGRKNECHRCRRGKPCRSAAGVQRMNAASLQRHFKKKYGKSRDEIIAMLDAQGWQCEICGAGLTEGKNGWATDHDHKTGLLRGMLCAKCNRVLGFFGDDPDKLLAAAEYLIRHARRNS